MQSLRDLEEREVEAWVLEHHFPRYRAEQIFRWVQEKDVTDFSEMENLPKDLRQALREEFSLALPELYRRYTSKLDETEKFLFTLADGHRSGIYGLSPREHRVYFHAGGLQDGMRVLCIDAIGPRKKLQLRRNARANCCDRASYGKKDFQCCADGIGRTLG